MLGLVHLVIAVLLAEALLLALTRRRLLGELAPHLLAGLALLLALRSTIAGDTTWAVAAWLGAAGAAHGAAVWLSARRRLA